MKIAAERPNVDRVRALRAPRRASRSGRATSPGRRPPRTRGRRRRRRPRTRSARSRSRRRRRARRRRAPCRPRCLPRSIAAMISSNCFSFTIGPTSTSGSAGSPTLPRSMRASSFSRNVVVDRRPGRRSAASPCTSGRPTRTRRRTTASTARSRSASAITISGLWPPSSSWTRLPSVVASSRTDVPDRDRAGERDRAHARVAHERGADRRSRGR